METKSINLLILSPLAEKATNEIIEWLLKTNKEFCRISEINDDDIKLISKNDFTIKTFSIFSPFG